LDSYGSGVLGAETRTSLWEGKKLVYRMVFIYENLIRKAIRKAIRKER
jgi:hypothetical protein